MRAFILLSAFFLYCLMCSACSSNTEKPASSQQKQQEKQAKAPARPTLSLVEKAEARETVPESDENLQTEPRVQQALLDGEDNGYGQNVSLPEARELRSFEGTIKGKAIHIAVTGVDSRIGDRTPHADANHIVSVYLDSGKIVITSVPRDTPADAGFTADSMLRFNILANVLPNRSRTSYHKELASIAGVPKIDYYMEVGFSQAMGVMELLGYKNPKSTLRVLRSRKGLGGDDYQRSYNQGQFIRQAVLRHFGKIDGFLGGLLVRGGLLLLNTDLSASKANEIIDALADHNFPRSPDDVLVRIRPTMRQKFAVYNFGDEEIIDALDQKLNRFNRSMAKKDSSFTAKASVNVVGKLTALLSQAAKDTAKHPNTVISQLQRPFEQRAWLQVADPVQRAEIRQKFALYLSAAYNKRGKKEQAQRVLETIAVEEELFKARKQRQPIPAPITEPTTPTTEKSVPIDQ